jgi:hypothetical protein
LRFIIKKDPALIIPIPEILTTDEETLAPLAPQFGGKPIGGGLQDV